VPNGGVVIPSGQNSASFTITTAAVTVAQTVTITATYGGLKQSATLAVNPPASATLTGVTVSPTYVTGGTNATGTVTLGGGSRGRNHRDLAEQLAGRCPGAAVRCYCSAGYDHGFVYDSDLPCDIHANRHDYGHGGVVKQTAVLTVQ